jgi:hypothetical protein
MAAGPFAVKKRTLVEAVPDVSVVTARALTATNRSFISNFLRLLLDSERFFNGLAVFQSGQGGAGS